jgi:hypothetical protein
MLDISNPDETIVNRGEAETETCGKRFRNRLPAPHAK